MTEPLSVVRYRSGKGCADGGALRRTVDRRRTTERPSLATDSASRCWIDQRIQTNERRTFVLRRPSSVLRFPERR